ncbi:MAG: YabP/YqfC family sporulation protein [Ruminococcus sp.]|jgi:sporulation protein YabP|nr:YabP/YqfC family sporulation protein [Ruminococcus sp.]
MENSTAKMFNNIILEERKRMSVSGVTDVDRFDEDIIHIYTTLGELTVKGHDLHVNDMSVTTGEMNIEGSIDSIIYGDMLTGKLSFWQKIFK